MKKKLCECLLDGQPAVVYTQTGESSSASATWPNAERRYIEVVIGIDEKWSQVLAAALHEAFEYTMTEHLQAYENAHSWHFCTAHRLFVLNHQQFTEACACTADFLQVITPPLLKAWKARDKELRKKKKS